MTLSCGTVTETATETKTHCNSLSSGSQATGAAKTREV